MESVKSSNTTGRRLVATRPRPAEDSIARWSRMTLMASVAMLALAPRFVADSYSVFEHTLSESGGQGVEWAWVFRVGVLLTTVAVLLLTSSARSSWPRRGRMWMRVYALALVFLVLLPESPWVGPTPDETVASLHTFAGASGAVAFILGVAAISAARTGAPLITRAYDWLVIAALVVIPQLMLLAVEYDGLLQRLMVLLGYIWLITESSRLAKQAPSSRLTRPAAPSERTSA